eukprot:1553851-Pleurochrysis_carterae.AAC.1
MVRLSGGGLGRKPAAAAAHARDAGMREASSCRPVNEQAVPKGRPVTDAENEAPQYGLHETSLPLSGCTVVVSAPPALRLSIETRVRGLGATTMESVGYGTTHLVFKDGVEQVCC